MRNIGDMVRRMVDEREPREPSDLLNGPHKLCECQSPGCGCPITIPRGDLR